MVQCGFSKGKIWQAIVSGKHVEDIDAEDWCATATKHRSLPAAFTYSFPRFSFWTITLTCGQIRLVLIGVCCRSGMQLIVLAAVF